jgi:glycerophosphoryl diester phosphodiesterase
MFKSVLAVVLIAGIFGIIHFARAASTLRKEPSGVQIYAHRGMRAYAPENSMPAYEAMMKVGTDWADMDVVFTRDGQIVIGHDPVLNPDIVRDASGQFLAKNKEAILHGSKEEQIAYIRKYAIKGLTYADLQKYDVGMLNPDAPYAKYFPDQISVNGTRMPLLRDFVHYVNKKTGGKMGFQIEMKTDPTHPEYSADSQKFAEALAKILKEEKIIDRAEIQAFDFSCLYALNKIDKKIKTAYLTSRDNEKGGGDDFLHADPKIAGAWTGGKLLKDFDGSIPKMVKALGGYAWEPEDFELTEETLKEAKALGLKVVVWSWPEKLGVAFDPKLVAKMIDWKVDGIITDDPGRLISMLAARGMRVPPNYR